MLLTTLLSVLALAAPQASEAFHPKPLFGTPGKAAYCYVDGTNQEGWSPRLFCWTPNDGYGIDLLYRGGRPTAQYYTRPSPIVHGYDRLVGWAPAAWLLRFGQTWQLRCPDPSNHSSCRAGGRGILAFTCVSRSTGLTCTNAAGHGFWLGRYRGVRRW